MWYNIYRTEESLKPKRKAERENKTMLNENGYYAFAITESWYNELRKDIHFKNVYMYQEKGWHEMTAEVDVMPEELEKFEEMSRDKGWM